MLKNGELDALQRMSVPQLKQRYLEVYGEQPRTPHKQFLIRRVAWRLQALREGGLSERARKRAEELARDADLRLTPPPALEAPAAASGATVAGLVAKDRRLPAPGTLLRRPYKDGVVLVKVLARGFEYEGQVYRSLTAVAKRVTGTHWNGYAFFGLENGGDQ